MNASGHQDLSHGSQTSGRSSERTSDIAVQARILCNGVIESLGRVEFDGKVDHPFTAHPKVDAQTGEASGFYVAFIPAWDTKFSAASWRMYSM